MTLNDWDFPIIAQGNNVYARSQSNPIATCWDAEIAQRIAQCLNEAGPVRDNGYTPLSLGGVTIGLVENADGSVSIVP